MSRVGSPANRIPRWPTPANSTRYAIIAHDSAPGNREVIRILGARSVAHPWRDNEDLVSTRAICPGPP